MELISKITDHPATLKVLVSVTVLLLLVLGRRLAVKTFDNSGLPPERRNRFLVQSRNAAIVLFVAATIVLWAEQLQTVALSLAAVAAAFVIATKELLLCLSGTFLRISARTFKLGDRIEVGGTRGDVIDIGPLTTTLLQVGPEATIHKLTGRTVVLPNSLFLTTAVTNETFTEKFALHATKIQLRADDPWEEIEALLLDAARRASADYIEEARENMDRVGHKHGLEPPNVDPKVWVSTSRDGIELILRYATPIRARGQIEQVVLREYLAGARSLTKPKTDAAPPAA